jgi:hypothetical protein
VLITLSELSQNADQKPSNSEMIAKMKGKAPEQAVLMFNEFKDVQWKALNSYVHGGYMLYSAMVQVTLSNKLLLLLSHQILS